MKRLLALLLFALPAFSQTSVTGRIETGPLAARPATCSTSDQYNTTDNNGVFICGPDNTWSAIGGSGSPSGTNGDVQIKNGTNFAASGVNDNGTKVAVSENIQFKGPQPYVDAQAFGARPIPGISGTLAKNTTIWVAGTTASSANVTLCGGLAGGNLATCQGLAAALTNGDGLTIFGAGPTCILSAPSSPYTGTVNTNGTSVGYVSGQNFDGAFEAGATITINSVNYIIAAISNRPTTTLTLTTSAGVQAGVAYSYPMPQAYPATAAANTGTNYVVPSPAQASTYSYKIAARDTSGCVSAASASMDITTGVSALGSVTGTITSLTKSGTTATALTPARSPETLVPGQMIRISGTSNDGEFGGETTVLTVPDNTHFTYPTTISTLVGGGSAATGGSYAMWNSNHIILPRPPAGVFQYGIYGRTSGAWNLIGVSMVTPAVPSGLASEEAYMKWDDFGSTMMAGGGFAYIWPTTAPGAATNDSLTTTIVSGGGTVNVVVANAASQTATGLGLVKDDAPGILAAAIKMKSISGGGGSLKLTQSPVNQGSVYPYVVQSYLDLCTGFAGSSFALIQGATLTLNDTMCIKAIQWRGDIDPALGSLSQAQFALGSHPLVSAALGNPGILTGAVDFHGVNLQNFYNMGNAIFLDGSGGGIPMGTFNQVGFLSAGVSNDYMGMPFRAMSAPIVSSAGLRFTDINITGGPSQTPNSTSTPLLAFHAIGEITFDGVMSNRRGVFFRVSDPGNNIKWEQRYENQGTITPLISLWGTNRAGSPGGVVYISDTIMDTSTEPIFSSLGCQTQMSLHVYSTFFGGGLSGCPSIMVDTINGPSQVANSRQLYAATIIDGFTNPTAQQAFNLSTKIGQNESIFADSAIPAAPTCGVNSPGSGLWLLYAPAYPGGPGPLSQPTAVECAGIPTTMNIPALIPAATGYYLYRNSSQTRGGFQVIVSGTCVATLPAGLTFSITGSSCGPGANTTAASGPAGIINSTVWGGIGSFSAINTPGNCTSSASPAVCTSAVSGAVTIAAAATTITVNTTAVTANSNPQITEVPAWGTRLGVTCNVTTGRTYTVTTITPGTSFVITASAAPAANPACLSYTFLN